MNQKITETSALLSNKTDQLPTSSRAVPREANSSLEEEFLKFWTNPPPPLSWICQNSVEREFRAGLAEEKFTCKQPSIGFRAVVTEDPAAIFDQGMNAYQFNRMPFFIKRWDKELTEKEKQQQDSLLWAILVCFPITLPWAALAVSVHATLSAIMWPFSYINSSSFSCGNRCGQNMYTGMYRSNWSTLAFSQEFNAAKPYHQTQNEFYFWRFIVVLPDGYIDFSAFCKHALENGIVNRPTDDDDDDAIRMHAPRPYDTKEIFPYGEQKISPEYIVAAIKLRNKTGDEMLHGADEASRLTECRLNPNSLYYDKLAHLTGTNFTSEQIVNILKPMISQVQPEKPDHYNQTLTMTR